MDFKGFLFWKALKLLKSFDDGGSTVEKYGRKTYGWRMLSLWYKGEASAW